VALLRQHGDQVIAWNPNSGAQLVQTTGHPLVASAVEDLVARAEQVTSKATIGDLVRDMLAFRLDDWSKRQNKALAGAATLGYGESSTTASLLEAPTIGDWPTWAVPNSLRETEPNVNLILEGHDHSAEGAPAWTIGGGIAVPRPPTVEERDEVDVSEAAG
jgi:hypothetical protein